MVPTPEGSKTPVTAAQFDRCMEGLLPPSAGLEQPNPCLAVAVSGGPDSLALTALLRDWCVARGVRLVALTVNHKLRDEVGEEIELLSRQLGLLGVTHRVINVDWGSDGLPAAGKVQIMARTQRYQLLQEECTKLGIR